MMAAQLEEMAKKQAQQEEEDRKVLEEKAKSRKTGADVQSAKERYLARKKGKTEEPSTSKAGQE